MSRHRSISADHGIVRAAAQRRPVDRNGCISMPSFQIPMKDCFVHWSISGAH